MKFPLYKMVGGLLPNDKQLKALKIYAWKMILGSFQWGEKACFQGRLLLVSGRVVIETVLMLHINCIKGSLNPSTLQDGPHRQL